MLKRNLIIVTSLIEIFIISCTKTLNIEVPGGNKQLVINGTLCPDSALSLIISKSKNVLDTTGIEYINNANIYVYECNVLIDTLINKGNGLYIGNIKPSINKAYSIKVEAIGVGIAEATDSIPEIVKIQKIDTALITNNSSELLNCSISFTDPINKENFYLLKILSADKTNPKKVQLQNFTCYDQIIDNTQAGGSLVVFNDDQINGKTHSTVVSMVYPRNKIVYFQLWSISKSFFNYCSSIAANRENNSILFSQQTQVITNIKGGLGIMAAYSISTDSIVF